MLLIVICEDTEKRLDNCLYEEAPSNFPLNFEQCVACAGRQIVPSGRREAHGGAACREDAKDPFLSD